MWGNTRQVWALLLGVTILALGNGLHGSLVGIRAAAENFDTTTTGFIMSAYSLGLILSAYLTPRLVTYVGHIRVFAAFASIVSTAVLLIPLWVDPLFWFAMRFVAGVCTSGLYIVAESWLNEAATNKTRGKLLSVYMTLTFAAMGCGQFLLNITDESGFARFIAVSALVSLALVPISLLRSEPPNIESVRGVSVVDIYRASPLAAVAVFTNGLGQSAFFSMGAVFGITLGLSLPYISLMMALPPVGVILSQYPIGVLSDRYDRRSVLTVLSFLAAALAAAAVPASQLSPFLLIGIVTAFGLVALPIYSLVVAYANDHLSKDQMLGASSKLILLYGIGAILGPLLAGEFMRQIGSGGFMAYMVLIYGGTGAFALFRTMKRPAVPAETAPVVQLSPDTTAVTTQALAGDAERATHMPAASAGSAKPAIAG
ncbi:MAG TPA: MFS transporter [Aestuariivirgaceae bacterium]|nr:MFS transporter [Aestuariivirgaceae bacterium]